MITDALLGLVMGIVKLLLQPFNFTINIPVQALTYLHGILSTVSYLLPWQGLIPIIVIFVGLMTFRIAVTLIKTIWDILPLL